MSITASAATYSADISRSKELPWYHKEIGSSLTPAAQKLLEEYSHLDPSEVEAHIYRVRDDAWSIFPWPCVGGFSFIKFGLSLHPQYPRLLNRLCAPSSKDKLLDVGTCLGQELRKLIYDGVPSQNVYGTDIFPEYESIGHALFRDAEKMQGHFIAADLFDETPNTPLVKTEGSWDVVSVMMVLHMFDWEKQAHACRRILKLLAQKPGSLVVGTQAGSIVPGEQELKPPFAKVGEKRTLYRQSKESFTELWMGVGKEEGVEIKIEVEYEEDVGEDDRVKQAAPGSDGKYFGAVKDRKMLFTVELM